MSEGVFKQGYADQYDHFYSDKDYESECDMLEQIFRHYCQKPVHTILDLGCGTGNHSISFARRGYEVHGVDLSEKMLAHALKKSQSERFNNHPIFSKGDVRNVELGKKFDAVLMMFAVLGYQITNEDVLAALQTVRKHLKQGGLFIFDVWYGPAVLAIRPSARIKVIPTQDGKVIRSASGSLDVNRHLTEVHYQIWKLSGNLLVDETEESHTMRFFFPMELSLFLSECKLKLENLNAFPSLDKPANEKTWNILTVARAV